MSQKPVLKEIMRTITYASRKTRASSIVDKDFGNCLVIGLKILLKRVLRAFLGGTFCIDNERPFWKNEAQAEKLGLSVNQPGYVLRYDTG